MQLCSKLIIIQLELWIHYAWYNDNFRENNQEREFAFKEISSQWQNSPQLASETKTSIRMLRFCFNRFCKIFSSVLLLPLVQGRTLSSVVAYQVFRSWFFMLQSSSESVWLALALKIILADLEFPSTKLKLSCTCLQNDSCICL